MIHWPEVSYPKNIEMDFSEGQFHKEIETNSPYQEKVVEQEFNRQTEKYHRDN